MNVDVFIVVEKGISYYSESQIKSVKSFAISGNRIMLNIKRIDRVSKITFTSELQGFDWTSVMNASDVETATNVFPYEESRDVHP